MKAILICFAMTYRAYCNAEMELALGRWNTNLAPSLRYSVQTFDNFVALDVRSTGGRSSADTRNGQ